MAKYRFVATHGVQLADSDEKNGLQVWAQFQRDSDLDTPEGEKRYVFETDDAKVATRVRGLKEYGVTEDKSSEDKSSDSGGDE